MVLAATGDVVAQTPGAGRSPVPQAGTERPAYRLVEPLSRVRFEVPADWQEHRQENDVTYSPRGADYRSKAFTYGVRVFVADGDRPDVVSRLENLMRSYSRTNPRMRAVGPYQVEPGLDRASVDYSNVPQDDPASRETGWVLVVRLTTGRMVGVLAVMPEAERARNAATLSRIRASLQVQ